jgi:hypothetical protein
MTVRSAQSITTEFTTRTFSTGAITSADSTPTGTLYVNGTADAATITVTNQATGIYKAAVTLPTLALGDVVSIVIAATVASISDKAKVWEDSADISDLYHADIHFTRDQTNAADEYEIRWFKNGVRVTSGITVPTIQVIKRADGTDLIAATTLTQIGSTGAYKYTASSSERLTQGEAGEVVVSATIDSATRTFSRMVGRDSA